MFELAPGTLHQISFCTSVVITHMVITHGYNHSTGTQDWKYLRTAKGFTGMDQKNVSCTVLRCVTNSKIPCTALEFASMGKTRFTLTVLGVGSIGWAYAPYKKPAGNKRVPKDPNARTLFELVRW
jgi:hypothetical protein